MKRILIARTDRIGDVLLSTPVFRAVREVCPTSHIAILVRPYAEDIVSGNPYIDEVIVYDKDGIHKSWLGTFLFALRLRRKKFDTAIILHPTNRIHIITALAGIPARIGFNKKLGFLLTKKIPHTKQFGEKHEMEYTLDVIRAVGIRPSHKVLYFPISRNICKKMEGYLGKTNVGGGGIFVAINPSASCPSKRWPIDYFARLADELVERAGAKIILISAADDKIYASEMLGKMKHKEALDFSGRTTVAELGALLRHCSLLISNDSGPVHIAAAVGTPVISIFGRMDPGLSPTRWKPLGENCITFHKDVGCRPCLAHRCKIGFKCLSTIGVEEIFDAAEKLLKKRELTTEQTNKPF